MDSYSDLSLEASGSRLLSQSPITSSQADLSISELSISDRPYTSPDKPFSLLAQPSTPIQSHRTASDDDQEGDAEYGNEAELTQRNIEADMQPDQEAEQTAEEREQAVRIKAKLREEKLQNDLFVLRKLNAAFSSFSEALDDVGSANERISGQLVQTERLLNKYIGILAKSEQFSQLIFDEDWDGADQDDMIIQREMEERAERAQREEEERAIAERRERERVERETRENREREEREQIAKEKTATSRGANSSGVRGVRGTRASNRAMRGSAPTRGSAASSRGQSSRVATTSRSSSIGRGTVRRG
ncbi:hypothetical protein D9757_000609 [Collybiopsis confluens]|uniref:DASH complex subunit DUO1 n=1 Tax=Collybiopsis confluens TaxID=2823264 RepID=A0A8H5MGJ8_9AGAR|nr:hypothetical protein D9757_000609 [Collybiopsis confluens]